MKVLENTWIFFLLLSRSYLVESSFDNVNSTPTKQKHHLENSFLWKFEVKTHVFISFVENYQSHPSVCQIILENRKVFEYNAYGLHINMADMYNMNNKQSKTWISALFYYKSRVVK